MKNATSENSVTRRHFIKSSSTLAAGLYLGGSSVKSAKAAGIADRYDGLKSGKYLGEVKIETEVKDETLFTEGPAVDRKGNVFFTNVPVEQILKWNPKKKRLTVFRENSNKANGLLFEANGNLLACEGGAGRVTRTDMKTGEISVLADKYNGFPIASPNDLTQDGKGRIYFTSRPGVDDPKKGNVNAVYRIDTDGKLSQLLAVPKTEMPNGIVTSPDNKKIYLIEAHPDADHTRNIQAFDLKADGSFANKKTLINFYPGRSGDGMCIDSEGNLYVAAGLHATRKTSETLDTRPGIHVISPEGKLLAFAKTPVDTITNCTFGGKDLKTLYVACGKYLVSIRTQIAGKAAYRPEA
jgi:gluconolactonase